MSFDISRMRNTRGALETRWHKADHPRTCIYPVILGMYLTHYGISLQEGKYLIFTDMVDFHAYHTHYNINGGKF